jgi:hypothetical protein
MAVANICRASVLSLGAATPSNAGCDCLHRSYIRRPKINSRPSVPTVDHYAERAFLSVRDEH